MYVYLQTVLVARPEGVGSPDVSGAIENTLAYSRDHSRATASVVHWRAAVASVQVLASHAPISVLQAQEHKTTHRVIRECSSLAKPVYARTMDSHTLLHAVAGTWERARKRHCSARHVR